MSLALIFRGTGRQAYAEIEEKAAEDEEQESEAKAEQSPKKLSLLSLSRNL